MALIRRVSRLFTADMHAVLDQLEEPEAILRQAIREMEEELARQRQREKSLQQELEATARQGEELRLAAGEIDGNLDLCFRDGNEALARRLVRRKLETLKLIEQAVARSAELQKQLAEMAQLIADNADQLDSLQQKAALLGTETSLRGGFGSGFESGSGGPGTVSQDDVEMAFLREKQARMPA